MRKKSNILDTCTVAEQQIIFGAFGYLTTPSKFNQLGKIAHFHFLV